MSRQVFCIGNQEGNAVIQIEIHGNLITSQTWTFFFKSNKNEGI